VAALVKGGSTEDQYARRGRRRHRHRKHPYLQDPTDSGGGSMGSNDIGIGGGGGGGSSSGGPSEGSDGSGVGAAWAAELAAAWAEVKEALAARSLSPSKTCYTLSSNVMGCFP